MHRLIPVAIFIDPPVLISSAHLSAEKMQVLLMESVAKIRRLVLRDGQSIRSVNRKKGLSRNTIKKYVQTTSLPSYQRKMPPVRNKLSGFETRFQERYDLELKRPAGNDEPPCSFMRGVLMSAMR